MKKDKENKTKGLNATKICFLIALFTFILMLIYANKSSLWFDDLFTISVSRKGIPFSLAVERVLNDAQAHPPLFYLFSYVWMKIVPYGTIWLRLPGLIFVAIGVFICGENAKLLKGVKSAIFGSLFAGTSFILIQQAGFAFRQYAPLFLMVNLLIYVYIKRMKHAGQERLIDIISYGAILLLLMYLHYFGCIIAAAFFIGDLYLMIRKKIKWQVVFSYLMAGSLFLPWFLHALKLILARKGIWWASIPTFETLHDYVFILFNNSILIFSCFILVIVFILSKKDFSFLNEYISKHHKFMLAQLAFTSVFVLIIVYIYSVYIHPSGSFFVLRYFISILPMMLIGAAIGLDLSLDFIMLKQTPQYREQIFSLVLVLFGAFLIKNVILEVSKTPYTANEPYEQAIEWIYEQKEAHDPHSLTIVNGGDVYVDVIDALEYYITHDGKRDKLNIKSSLDFGLEQEPTWQRIYRFDGHDLISNKAKDNLWHYYEQISENTELKVKVYQRKDSSDQ